MGGWGCVARRFMNAAFMPGRWHMQALISTRRRMNTWPWRHLTATGLASRTKASIAARLPASGTAS